MDETWIHHFTPESKRQSAGTVMALVFWDARGIIYIDYLEKGKYINSDYYIELLVRLKDEIAKNDCT